MSTSSAGAAIGRPPAEPAFPACHSEQSEESVPPAVDKATGNRQQATGDGGHEATGNRQQATGDGGSEATGNRQQATGDGGSEAAGNSYLSLVTCHLSPVTCPLSPDARPLSLPSAWDALLDHPLNRDPHRRTLAAAEAAAQLETVYPPREDWFAALALTPPERVRVVILGQDPYHEPDQAMGLAFSVRPGVKLPPSLRNIYKELESDLGRPAPETGDLRPWAEQGVLLLNTVLTVAAGRANSHKSFGWQALTAEILAAAARLPQPIAFLLWGAPAQKAYAQATEPVAAHSVRHPCEGIGNRQQATEPVAAHSVRHPCEATGNRQQATGDGEREAPVTCHLSPVTCPLSPVPCSLSPVPSPAPRLILTAPHPSPLSAYRGFFGSRPFSRINAFLTEHGEAPIRWV